MAFSYIDNLNIPNKKIGSVLRSYEYNATVDKINELVNVDNEIVDRLNYTPLFVNSNKYENNPGSPAKSVTLIDKDQTRLYPFTTTSYVVSDDGTPIERYIDQQTQEVQDNAYSYAYYLVEAAELFGSTYIYIDQWNRICVKNEDLYKYIGQTLVDNEYIYYGPDNKIHLYTVYDKIKVIEPIPNQFLNSIQ